MATLPLSLAVGSYDHVRDLQPRGISLTTINLRIEEIFFRFTRFREWDASEMSFGKVVALMADPERALEESVREELGISAQRITPLREGTVTGTATLFGALIPVAPFLIMSGKPAIAASFALAMLSHFGVGAARSVFTGRSVVRSGMDMFIVGLGVAAVGYVVGDLVARAL